MGPHLTSACSGGQVTIANTGSYRSWARRALTAGLPPLTTAAALLALAALSPPTGSRQLRRSKSELFFVVAGRHRDGSGGSFASARSKTFWEGLDVYYYVGLRIQPSANVPVQPVSDSHYVGVNHRPAPTTC